MTEQTEHLSHKMYKKLDVTRWEFFDLLNRLLETEDKMSPSAPIYVWHPQISLSLYERGADTRVASTAAGLGTGDAQVVQMPSLNGAK